MSSKKFWIGISAVAIAYSSGWIVGQHLIEEGWVLGCIGMFIAGILSSMARENS